MANFLVGRLALGSGTTSFVELAGLGYGRAAITMSPLIAGQTFNASGVTFSAAGSWLTATQFGLYDLSGNLLLWWVNTQPFTLSIGQNQTYQPNTFQLQFPDLTNSPPLASVQFSAGTAVGSVSSGATLMAGVAMQSTAGVLSPQSFQTVTAPTVAPAGATVAGASIITVNVGGITNSTDNTLNNRYPCWAPWGSALTDIVLSVPAFVFAAPEVDQTTTLTVTAAIEYPSGTYWAAYYQDGTRNMVVTPGRGLFSFQPIQGLVIPAGAQFWVKIFGSWSGTLTVGGPANLLQGHVNLSGTGLADQTLTTVSGGTGSASMWPIPYAKLSKSLPVLGILGTSQDFGTGDYIDANNGTIAWGRAFRGQIPIHTVARVGITQGQILSRVDGWSQIFLNKITHLLCDTATNDIFTGISLATTQANLIQLTAPYIARGVKVICSTVMPRTNSTDLWHSLANQTIPNAGYETVRQQFNAWITANWQTLGFAAIFDFASALAAPTDPTRFGFDPNPIDTISGYITRAFPVMSNGQGGSVASMPIAFGGGAGALCFPPSSTISTIVRNHPDDITGSGAVVTGTINASGALTAWNVVSGGANYQYPPYIHPPCRWTYDGIHLTGAGYDQAYVKLGLSPSKLP